MSDIPHSHSNSCLENEYNRVLKKPSIPPVLKSVSILKKKSDFHSGATVSFDLDKSGEGLPETGYWSCGDSLKDGDNKSILKQRRSSWGNSEPQLQSILKRKLSETSVSVSTRSLPGMFSTSSVGSEIGFVGAGSSPEPRSILMKRSSEDLVLEEVKPILKKGGEFSIGIRPILKKPGKHSACRSILKRFNDEGFDNNERPARRLSEPGPFRKMNSRTSSEEEILNSMSVVEKRSLFMSQEYTKRRFTQPITNIEVDAAIKNVEVVGRPVTATAAPEPKSVEGVNKCSRSPGTVMQDEATPDLDSNSDMPGSISAKITALKTHGESWNKRAKKSEQRDHKQVEQVEKDLSTRLNMLQNSQSTWKSRVQDTEFLDQENLDKDKDITTRLNMLEKSQCTWKSRVSDPDTLHLTVQGRLEKAGIRKSLLEIDNSRSENSRSHFKEFKTRSLDKTKSDTVDSSPTPTKPDQIKIKAADLGQSLKLTPKTSSPGEPKTIQIHSNTSPEFERFFNSKLDLLCDSDVLISDSSFDALLNNNRNFIGFKKSVKLNRKHATKHNPVKALAERLEKQCYVEERLDLNLESSNKLAAVALAGLASTEDFTSVKLKPTERKIIKQVVLIKIKGKRFVQCRLIEPCIGSLTSGDCYLLISGDKLYNFIGSFSNRVEKAKSTDLASAILKNKELGCSASKIISIEEPSGGYYEEFITLLGSGELTLDRDLGDESDEAYENQVVGRNKVYTIDFDREQLVLYQESSQPKHCILTPTSIYVFDFGSEVYVWVGSRVDVSDKNLAHRLGSSHFKSCNAPVHALFKKLTQHMEPSLFKSKFQDWPEEVHKPDLGFTMSDPISNLEPVTAEDLELALAQMEEAGLVLENFDVGRGREVKIEVFSYTVSTMQVSTWLVKDCLIKLEDNNNLYSTESYVIRWTYSVQVKKSRSNHDVGRTRTAYFYWHGSDSSLKEQGTCALLTIDLDEEKGPQIRLVQGHEPPAFLNLFKGRLLIHSGSEVECLKKDSRLFMSMGCVKEEGHLLEVPFDRTSFRSRSSLLCKTGSKLFIWHGSESHEVSREIAVNAATANFTVDSQVQVEEFSEPADFLDSLRISDLKTWRISYGSSDSSSSENSSVHSNPILFRFSSLTEFTAVLIQSPRFGSGLKDPFPYTQEDLYSVQQPALFMFQTPNKTWLWEGVPDSNEDSTGTCQSRWTLTKKSALLTVQDYSLYKDTEPVLVTAGSEPAEFKSYFPCWRDCVPSKDDVSVHQYQSFEQAFTNYNRCRYTHQELIQRPDGVDLNRLESYLNEEEFQNLFGMSRSDFDKLQAWRKTELRKKAGLF